MSTYREAQRGFCHILREHFSPIPDGPHDYQGDMLPPLSCPRLVDRPREPRQLFCFVLICIVLTAVIAVLIWLSGGVEPEVEMTSVTSTRELRPIPKQLIQMTKDPSSLSVTYHIEEDRREKPLALLVLVQSAAANSDMRRAVRETWMNYDSVGQEVTVVFTVAAHGLSSDRQLLLQAEAEQYRDLAIFPDSSGLPESEYLLYQLGWASTTFTYQYLLKTRDSFYVRVDELVHELHQHIDREPQSIALYWGFFEGNRSAKQHWRGKHTEPDWFLCNEFIRFAHSGGYIISHSVAQRLVRLADYLQLYLNEDISLATWLAPFGDMTWKHDVRFDTDSGQSRSCQNTFLIFHVSDHSDMVRHWQRLIESGLVCHN